MEFYGKQRISRVKIVSIIIGVLIVALLLANVLFDGPINEKKEIVKIISKKVKTKIYFNKCMMCNFTPQNYKPTSTFKDLLITTMFKTPTNIFPAIRSLRTTQSQASVVIITDNETLRTIPLLAMKDLMHCSLQFEVVEKREMSMLHFFTWRQQQYLNYLSENKDKYNRVIIFDLFDTVFQGDPFTKDLHNNKIYFSVENQTYDRSPYNQQLIKPLVEKGILNNITFLLDKPVINGGLMGGGINEVIAFLQLYMSNFKNDFSNVYVDDQPFINYIVHSKMLENMQIPYEFDSRREMLVSVSASLKKLGSFVMGNVTHPDARRPMLVIHQFKQKKEFNIEVYRACPRGNIKIPNYMPKLKERQIEELEKCLRENCSKLWYRN